MSGIGRIEELEKTIKYFKENIDKFHIGEENIDELAIAIELTKNKVISDIVTASLNNKPQIKRQIAEAMVHLDYKKDEIEKKMQEIQEKIEKIEKRKEIVIEPGVRVEFQERKHEQDLKDIEQEVKRLEQERKEVQAKIDRVNKIINNLKTPEKLLETLIGDDDRGRRKYLAYESLKRLERNGVDVGLLLTVEKDGEKYICQEDVKILLEIATSPSLIQELKEIKAKKLKINEEHTTSKEEKLIKANKSKIDVGYTIKNDASNYMKAILGLYDCASEMFKLKQEDEVIELDSINSVKKAFFKTFAKNKYEEILVKEKEQEKTDLSRKNRMEELNNKIRVYSDLCNYNPKVKQKLIERWESKILKEDGFTEAKRVLYNTPREEYSQMPGHEELYVLLNYLNQFENRDKASAELITYAESTIKSSIDKFSNEILELKSIIDEKKKDEKYQIEQLKNSSSPIVKKALETGFDPEKIDNLEILKKFESKDSDGIAPATDLLVLYTVTKEENVKNAKAAKKAGYKLDPKKIEEEIKKGEGIINQVLREYKEIADGIEI